MSICYFKHEHIVRLVCVSRLLAIFPIGVKAARVRGMGHGAVGFRYGGNWGGCGVGFYPFYHLDISASDKVAGRSGKFTQ